MTGTGFALRHPDVLAADQPCVPLADPNEDGPWSKRCLTHELPWTSGIGCEVASRRSRAIIAQQRAEEHEARLRRAAATRAGLLTLVDIGCEIYSLTHQNQRGTAVGGVVVAVDDSGDVETGERLRRYAVLDIFDRPLTPVYIAEDEVNQSEIAVASGALLTRLFGALAWEQAGAFAKRKDGRVSRLMVDTRIADRHRWGTALLHSMGMS